MNSILSLPVLIGAGALVAAVLSYLMARLIATGTGARLDLPGPRSSHSEPTPRGGGLGIVMVGLFALLALAWAGAWPVSVWQSLLALSAVAAIGLLDDWRPQPAWRRLLVHLAAAGLLAAATVVGAEGLRVAWPLVLLSTAVLVWSTNLHNFMDGINGLLGLQCLWYGAVFAVVLGLAGEYGAALFALLLAAAALGFLPMNYPRARVFLGDGAAGFIGLAFAWLALFAAVQGLLSPPESLIVASAFLVDSSATLLSRLARREPIWQAHRQHLYQRLVHAGQSHGAVSAWYLLWNLLIALPALYMARSNDSQRWSIAVALLVLALLVWWLARRFSMRKMASLEAP